MVIIELTQNDQFGEDGPQAGNQGFILTYLSSDPDDHDEHWYAVKFAGYEKTGYYVLNNRQFKILDMQN